MQGVVDWLLGVIPDYLRLLITFASLTLAAFVVWRSTTAATWKGERDAAITKAARLDEENKRLDGEKTRLETELAKQQARTDLESLRAENNAGHSAIVTALQALSISEAERHAETIKMVHGYQSQMAETFAVMQETLRQLVQQSNK